MKYYAPIKISDNIRETSEGYLICVGVPIARTGEQIYLASEINIGEVVIEPGEDGKIIITREENEVFRPQTIASFEGQSITINHPSDFVDTDNYQTLTRGHAQNIRRGEGEEKEFLLADLLIKDSIAVNLVKSGLRELSCGYEADYIETGKGRGKQTNIIGNHIALVQQGRAGHDISIKDHKSKGDKIKMNIKDQLKKIFSKVMDEAETFEKEEKKEEKDAVDPKKEGGEKASYDEVVKAIKDLSSKIESFKPKDETPKEKIKEKEEGQEDEEGEETPTMEDRMAVVETGLAKLLEGKAEDEDSEKKKKEEGSEDDDFEESSMIGDTSARVEILVPGLKLTKDVKAIALKKFYGTKEGKKVMDSLSGGKKLTFDSVDIVDNLFIAASEIIKSKRVKDLAATRNPGNHQAVIDEQKENVTAESLNKKNEEFWNKRNK